MTLAIALLSLVPTTALCPGATDPDPVEPAVFERVHVVGASVSSGFGTRREFGATLQLGHVLDVALPDATDVATSADEFMFLDPVETGDDQMERALDQEATLLVAVDFLFWYAYGVVLGEEARIERFEDGLAALEQFDGPIVVGDLPDVRYALPGGMIMEIQVPAAKTLERCNARLAAWAKERGEVHLVPLARFLGGLEDAEEVVVREHRYPKPFETLLQRDLLHANVDGTIALVRLLLDSIVGIDDVKGVTWDHATLREEVTATYGPSELVPSGGERRTPGDRAPELPEHAAAPPPRRRTA